MSKKWYSSKTMWANAIALGATWIANLTGQTITAEQQVAILAVLNIILRAVTKETIIW